MAKAQTVVFGRRQRGPRMTGVALCACASSASPASHHCWERKNELHNSHDAFVLVLFIGLGPLLSLPHLAVQRKTALLWGQGVLDQVRMDPPEVCNPADACRCDLRRQDKTKAKALSGLEFKAFGFFSSAKRAETFRI